MRWSGRDESSNIEDRRGFGGRGIAVSGGGLLLLVVAYFLGIDPSLLLNLQSNAPSTHVEKSDRSEKDPAASFTGVVLRDTELVWGKLFQQAGVQYRQPKLVMYSGAVESACGFAQAAVGPFYCPGDAKVYIDLSFYRDLESKLGARGDFAKAYVIAHEVGHHIQHLVGWERSFGNATGENARGGSVQRELQADYLAGVWAHHADKDFKYLEKGDVANALNAAAQIGDDRLQMRSKGYVVPDSFSHGSSAQRVKAFRSGFESGSLAGAKEYLQ